MRRIAIALVLLACAGPALAFPFIGIFEDEDPTVGNCHVDVAQYVSTTVYVVAFLYDVPELTAAEFRIHNLPDPNEVLIQPMWDTTLVIGDLGYGIALAFGDPVPGFFAHLGSIDFFVITPPGDDHTMEIRESLASDQLAIVDGDFVTHAVSGGPFTFNPTQEWSECLPIIYPPTATGSSNLSRVKALY